MPAGGASGRGSTPAPCFLIISFFRLRKKNTSARSHSCHTSFRHDTIVWANPLENRRHKSQAPNMPNLPTPQLLERLPPGVRLPGFTSEYCIGKRNYFAKIFPFYHSSKALRTLDKSLSQPCFHFGHLLRPEKFST